jgi:hypothetical protein
LGGIGATDSLSGFKVAAHVATIAVARTIPKMSASLSGFGAMSVSWHKSPLRYLDFRLEEEIARDE